MHDQNQKHLITDRTAASHENMRKAILLLAVCVVVSVFICTAAAANAERKIDRSNYAYIGGDYAGIDHAAKSVFYVEIYDSDYSAVGSGSGFIMFDEGLFITNQHVIDGASYLVIMDDDGKQYVLDQVAISDSEHDIAILQFPDAKLYYDSLPYDTAFDQLKRGQAVLAIGSPKGLPGTVSDGIISAFPKFQGEDIRFIQITAPISHGSSGGCLLNEKLKVIGVTSAGVDEGQNLGFAIPVSIVEQLYLQWNKRDTLTLGTRSSWDTVGNGIHHRITGETGKPRIQGGSSGVTQTQPPAAKADVRLDVTWDKTRKDKYALTVNGKTVSWDQTVESAARFCNQNGVRMIHFDNDVKKDAYLETEKSIRFAESIDCEPGQFYLRRAANSTKLNGIDINISRSKNQSITEQRARDAYGKLLQKFGSPSKMSYYINQKLIDAQFNDIAEAVSLLSQNEYCFLTIGFNNLDFFVVHRPLDNGYEFVVYLHLSPW